jgi:acetyl-CoA acetyltransferase
MYGIKNKVVIVGSGFSKVSRTPDENLGRLTIEACTKAVESSGLTWADIDGIATYPSTAGAGGAVEGIDMTGVAYLAQTLGLRDLRWYVQTDRGTVSGVLAATVTAVAAGVCDFAVVWKSMHVPRGLFGAFSANVAPGDSQFSAPYGLAGGAVPMFALPYSEYVARYGATREHMASFIVGNRKNANMNPDAIFYEKPLQRDDYLNDRMISDPLSVLDCDMPVDGCGAVVVTRAELANDLPVKPAYIVGHASGGIPFQHGPVMRWDDWYANAKHVGDMLWENSGLKQSDVDMASLYDGFSWFTYLWLEALGFCGVGEAFEFVQDGRVAIGGDLPLNTSGGALGMGRLHGMPQLVEAVRQVQGLCGPRQVEGAEVAIAHAGSALHGGSIFAFAGEPIA